MSWDDHVGNLLQNKELKHVAICGKNPASVWAKSASMSNISTDEISKLWSKSTSYMISGTKYLKVGNNLDSDMLNLKEVGGEAGYKQNISVGMTKKCLVIGVGQIDCQGGDVSKVVGKYRDYLSAMDM